MTDTKRLRRIGEAVGIELGRDSGEIIKAAAAEVDRLREALSRLLDDCETANRKWVDGIGIGAIDMNAISRGRAALQGESKC